MIYDWFKDALKHFGHKRIDDFTSLRGCYRLGAEAVLRRFAHREEMRHVVRFEGNTETVQKASMVKGVIEESEMPFERPWASLRADDEILFVFGSVADAVRFRILWD